MKLHNIIWLAALPLAFVACQNEEVLTENVNRQPVHSLKAGMPETMSSRAQIFFGNEDDEREYFTWNANDQFAVYNQSKFDAANPAIFKIQGDEEYLGNWGDFKTESDALMVGDKVMAIYPANCVDEDGYAWLDIPNAEFVSGSDEEWREYFANHLYLVAATTLNDDIEQIHFEHQSAIIRVTYYNTTSESQKIKSVIVDGKNGAKFLRKTNMNMRDGGQNYSGTGNWLKNDFSDLVVAAGEKKDFYFLLLGQDNGEYPEGSSIVIHVDTEQRGYVTTELPMAKIAEANNGVGHIEKGKRYWFNVMQTENELKWAMEAGIMITNLPLIAAIENVYPGFQFQKTPEGYIDVYENFELIQNIHGLKLENQNLSDLSGIECFFNLEGLNVSYNNLSEVDFSKLHALTFLSLIDCPLKSLDISKNTALESLNIGGCNLQSINTSNNPKLYYLQCDNNQFTSLDLSQNLALNHIDCRNNKLTYVDFSHNTALTSLHCYDNQIKELDIHNNTLLEVLFCQGNQIKTLDISANEALVEVWCGRQKTERGEDQTIIVEVNDQQKANIESLFDFSWGNENVHIGPMIPVNGGTAGGGNFGSGGKF